MATLTTAGLAYGTEASVLKTVYLESFSNESVKAKIFIL